MKRGYLVGSIVVTLAALFLFACNGDDDQSPRTSVNKGEGIEMFQQREFTNY